MSRDSSPPIDPKRLTFLALVAVKEVVAKRSSGPVAQSTALRVILGYLHSANGGDRRIYDEFWGYCRATAFSGSGRDYAASSHMFSCWQGMVRQAGIPLTIEMMDRFNSFARSPDHDNVVSRMKKGAADATPSPVTPGTAPAPGARPANGAA